MLFSWMNFSMVQVMMKWTCLGSYHQWQEYLCVESFPSLATTCAKKNDRHCSSQPPLSTPVTEIASKCFHSSAPAESRACSLTKATFTSNLAMTLSKRLRPENVPGTPVPIFLFSAFTTWFSILACDGLQRTQAPPSWGYYLTFPNFPKTTLIFGDLVA